MSTLTERLRLRAGRLQHAAIQHVVDRVTGLHADEVTVEGYRMPFVIGGTGPAILFLHGFADSRETWSFTLRLLVSQFTVIAPDLPGYGAADPVPAKEATLARQAHLVALFLDQLGRRAVHLVGNSMGGGIAVRFAHDHPERALTLTLLGPMGHVQERSDAHRLWEEGVNPLLPKTLDEYDTMLTYVLGKKLPLNRSLRTFMADRTRQRHDDLREYFDVLLDETHDEGVPAGLDHLDHPTLVIHGRDDRVIHYSTGAYYERLMPNVRVVVLDEIGHAPQLEAPRVVARYVREMVSSGGAVLQSTMTNPTVE